MGVLEDLRSARDSFERREWVAAYEELSRLDDADLAGADFEALATSAHLLGQRNDCIQSLQRAYRYRIEQDEPAAAVRVAFWLALILVEGGEPAVAGAWIARGERLLTQIDGDVVEHGYLLVHQLFGHVRRGDFAAALHTAEQITAYGERFGDPDLLAFGLNAQGRGLTMAGRVPEGLALLDEGMVGVLDGEVSPIFAGMVYCSMIEACMWVGDHGRVAQWTHALTEWCELQPGLVAFTGQCAVHRAQLLRICGAWSDAWSELDLADERYRRIGAGPALGLVHRERAELLRLSGQYDAAALAFTAAIEWGEDGQPGRLLLDLAQGHTDEAVIEARRLLEKRTDPVGRSQLLPAAVEVFLRGGARAEAEQASAELAGLAHSFECDSLLAAAAFAAAQVCLGNGEAEESLRLVQEATSRWTSLSAPFEVARCHLLAAQAHQQRGDQATGRTFLVAAAAAFADLGAAVAGAEAEALLNADTPASAPRGLTEREIDVLRLVAAGRSNAEIGRTLTIAEKTVARHLSNIFGKLDVGSRTAAAAFAYEHGLVTPTETPSP